MASFQFLQLDTTAPTLKIYAPTYTNKYTENYISIMSSEDIGSVLSLYSIDAKGNRFEHTFIIEENELIGVIRFNQHAIGVSSLYYQVTDSVDNVSGIYKADINITENIKANPVIYCKYMKMKSKLLIKPKYIKYLLKLEKSRYRAMIKNNTNRRRAIIKIKR